MQAVQRRALALATFAIFCMLTGCAYRLPAPTPPSLQRLKIQAATPQNYIVQTNWDTAEYPVPKDGTVTLQIPGGREPCGVYLFNVIKVRGGPRRHDWKVQIKSSEKMVKQVSVADVSRLPQDSDGFHVLTLEP